MNNLRLFKSRRDLLNLLGCGIATLAVGAAAPAKADDVSGTWITAVNKYGEVIQIQFASDGTYRRTYQLGPGDTTIEVGQFEPQRNGSVRLYNIRWSNRSMKPNQEEILDRTDQNTLTMRDSQRSALRRLG